MTYQERKRQAKSYLGKTVSVKIDRPVGYIHKKENYTLRYPINYGYIPGVIGGDGEELDVYVLGVRQPLEEFTGRVIGIVNREDDVEDKLVVAPHNYRINQAKIAESIRFQERYYKSSIDALYQKSCGAVIYRKKAGKTEYLLLLQKRSHTWSFPKGHMEAFETEKKTAAREIFEETGYRVCFRPEFRHEIQYTVCTSIKKLVVLYLARVRKNPHIQRSEISAYKWVDAEEAKKLLFENYHDLIDEAESYIREHDNATEKTEEKINA